MTITPNVAIRDGPSQAGFARSLGRSMATLERWITYATTGHDREDADALFLERGRTCHEENFVLSILAQN